MIKINNELKQKINGSSLGEFGSFNKSMLFNGSVLFSFSSTIINNILNNIAKGIAYQKGNFGYHNIYNAVTPAYRLGDQLKDSGISFW